MNDIKELRTLVNKFVSSDELISSEEIIDQVNTLFETLSDSKFKTILIATVKPIYAKKEELTELTKNTSGRSKLKKKYNSLNGILEFLFQTYEAYLKDEQSYKDYRSLVLEKEEEEMNILLQDLETVGYSKLENHRKRAFEFFKSLDSSENFEYLKYKVLEYYSKINPILESIEKDKDIVSIRIDETTRDLEQEDIDGEVIVDELTGEPIPLREILENNCLDYGSQLLDLKHHFQVLYDFKLKLEKDFSFIKKEDKDNSSLDTISQDKTEDASVDKAIKSTNDQSEKNWKEMFKDKARFNQFKEYVEKHIQNPYADYSFLFHAMSENELLYHSDIRHKNFMIWLQDNDFIDQDAFDDFIICGSFEKRYASKARKLTFQKIFGDEFFS